MSQCDDCKNNDGRDLHDWPCSVCIWNPLSIVFEDHYVVKG